jgi:hypothetical protein
MSTKTRHGLTMEQVDRLRLIAKGEGSVRKAYSEPSNDGLTGLQVYDLRGPAARLVPVVAVLRNRIPRRQAPQRSTGLHWKAITAINTGKILPGVSEGNRNAPIAQTTADYFAEYAGLGMENFNTFEAKYSMSEDPEALARLDALESLINGEERVILGGNQTVSFGVAPTPAGAVVTASTGTLTAQTWICHVVALTFEGKYLATVAGGVATSFSRTNADGSVDTIAGGSSNKSLISAGVAVTGTNHILWKWASVPGAAGYAVFVGTATANAALLDIVDTNECLQKANPTGTQLATAITADNSRNTLVFDGIITQLAKPGSGATIKSANSDALTVGSDGTISIFNDLFKEMWEKTNTGPSELMTGAATRMALSKAVMAAGGATPFIQVTVNAGAGGIKTGMTIEAIFNPYTGEFVPFTNHPYMPKGMIVALTAQLPYAIPGVSGRTPWIIETRQEYYSIKWPYRTRKDEFGVYVDEGLIGTVPVSHGLIQDIDTNV